MGKSYKDRGRIRFLHENDALDGHFKKKHGRATKKSRRQESREIIDDSIEEDLTPLEEPTQDSTGDIDK